MLRINSALTPVVLCTHSSSVRTQAVAIGNEQWAIGPKTGEGQQPKHFAFKL